jgi:hypothetical protein
MISSASALLLALPEPGVYRVALVGGGLCYAAVEVEAGPDDQPAVVLVVDPDSEGMRALTTGIGR